MNEFIVWDGNKFYQDSSYSYLTLRQDGKVYKESNDDYGGNTSTLTTLKPLFYIGKKDINNKKIYADFSIVEFKDHKKDKFLGYFTYSNIKLAYEIKILDYIIDDNFMPILTYCKDDISNLKIVDTIQENKLRLIKDK